MFLLNHERARTGEVTSTHALRTRYFLCPRVGTSTTISHCASCDTHPVSRIAQPDSFTILQQLVQSDLVLAELAAVIPGADCHDAVTGRSC